MTTITVTPTVTFEITREALDALLELLNNAKIEAPSLPGYFLGWEWTEYAPGRGMLMTTMSSRE